MALFSIHIAFEDGSNPYCRFNMDNDAYEDEIAKWRKKYRLAVEKREEWDGGWLIFMRAMAKE